MKNAIALAISLLMPAVPVLADNPPDQTAQAAKADAKMTTDAVATGDAVQAGTRNAQTMPGVGASMVVTETKVETAPKTPEAQPVETKDQVKSHQKNDPPAPDTAGAKKTSFLSGMKGKVTNLLTKHYVLAGFILGGMLGVIGGPAGVVVGACLGAVTADAIHFFMKK